ncbi:hypothetical protein [Pleionea sp. CnH1-48]|uniref:hypothetical protein n=1 Tax=Pleionea sp. CnH1-48 TaxID=2954494 RepID=UPI0020985285|nr:hypothetical protein [Pleionea sp. CnH1-48]MCO7222677.1 hypothetical protein [Pleionea sp. CnH1-48]
MSEYRYNYYDFGELFSSAYYLELMNENRAIGFLEHELAKIQGYSKYIDKYPGIACEPLEFLYCCSKSVCNINELLLQDLLSFNWRGVIWGAWIALITPYNRDYFLAHLEKLDDVHEKQEWLVNLALEHIKGRDSEHPVYCYAEEIRAALSQMEKVTIPLRKYPSLREEVEYTDKQNECRAIYHAEGADAAIEFLNSSPKFEWELSYRQWRLTLKSARL